MKTQGAASFSWKNMLDKEVFAGLLFALPFLYAELGISPRFFYGVGLTLFLMVAAVVDARSGHIYNRFLLAMFFYLAVCFLVDFLYGYFFLDVGAFAMLVDGFWNFAGAFFGAGFFFLIALLSRGMGMGDVKYVCLLGLAIGGRALCFALVIAFFTATVWGIFLAIRRRTMRVTLPFAPFLSVGSFAAFLGAERMENFILLEGIL